MVADRKPCRNRKAFETIKPLNSSNPTSFKFPVNISKFKTPSFYAREVNIRYRAGSSIPRRAFEVGDRLVYEKHQFVAFFVSLLKDYHNHFKKSSKILKKVKNE